MNGTRCQRTKEGLGRRGWGMGWLLFKITPFCTGHGSTQKVLQWIAHGPYWGHLWGSKNEAEDLEPSYSAGRCVTGGSCYGKQPGSFSLIKHRMVLWPSSSAPGCAPKRNRHVLTQRLVHRHSHQRYSREPKGPSTDGCVNKLWSVLPWNMSQP